MTTEHEASRTLVKSPPELWAECSDAGSLARHLGEFGEITITRLEPETTVAWEGEHASGTVRIEPSGWGTRVTLTAHTKAEAVEPVAEEGPVGEEESVGEERESAAPEVASGIGEPIATEGASASQPVALAGEEKENVVEGPLEAPDPGRPSHAGAFRIRWRGATGRVRGWFRAEQVAEPADPEWSVAAEAPESPSFGAQETEESFPPSAFGEPTAAAEDLVPVDNEPETEPEPAKPELDSGAVLTAALESLGQAHHRPFSRA